MSPDHAIDHELSPSCYDIAVVSLVEGPQTNYCVKWILSQRRPSGTWGATDDLCWNDTYISTYAASVALRAAGDDSAADAAIVALRTVDTTRPMPETMSFGGFVEFLDKVNADRGWPAPDHPESVCLLVGDERDKWNRMVEWPHFYNPELSIAGFCAERAYGDDRIDLSRLLGSFQTTNGAISDSPGASAGVVLEYNRRGQGADLARVENLERYLTVHSPARLGYLDRLPHFVTAWSAMFAAEVGPLEPALADAAAAMMRGYSGKLICPIGSSTVPGDPDSTACALIAAYLAGLPLPPHPGTEDLYDRDAGCYRTFMFERDGSVSTNIHMTGLLHLTGEHRRRDEVLQWLYHKLVDEETDRCKWHISPTYALGEAARVLAAINTPTAHAIHGRAVTRLLELQNDDGGWGVLDSTVEETGYAVLGLCAAPAPHLSDDFLTAARDFLTEAGEGYEPLWIGKTLYCLRPLVPLLHRVALERIRQVTQQGRVQAALPSGPPPGQALPAPEAITPR